jgi:hypothetical protein
MKAMNIRIRFALLASVLLIAAQPFAAQESQLVVRLNRDFGYGGLDNRIEGLFTISAEGPTDLARVDFYIDAEIINSDTTEPFAYQFTTNDYSMGEHHLFAIGVMESGIELRSNEIVSVFVSPEESRQAAFEIIVPIVAVVLVVMVLAAGLPMLFGRGKRPTIGQYGPLGAAICPKCGLPSPYNFLSPNMVVGKLQRCPHCGKWSIMRRASPADLTLAEELWRQQEGGSPVANDGRQDRERRQIDDSRYED